MDAMILGDEVDDDVEDKGRDVLLVCVCEDVEEDNC